MREFGMESNRNLDWHNNTKYTSNTVCFSLVQHNTFDGEKEIGIKLINVKKKATE
jgi:hypothetical protein